MNIGTNVTAPEYVNACKHEILTWNNRIAMCIANDDLRQADACSRRMQNAIEQAIAAREGKAS